MDEQVVAKSETQPVKPVVQPETAGGEEKLVKQLTPSDQKKGLFGVLLPALVILVIILGGVGTGYFLANRGLGSLSIGGTGSGGKGNLTGGVNEAGFKDEESFPDKAEGRIELNEDEEMPEGSHKLIREGGEGKTAFLTSSVVDLNEFKGKCVEVWGETFAAQKAGWLMDIGYIRKIDKCPKGV